MVSVYRELETERMSMSVPLAMDESVERSRASNERDSDAMELEEVDPRNKGKETKKKPFLNAAVYDKLHGLPSDPDW
jgi:hypothetical protein